MYPEPEPGQQDENKLHLLHILLLKTIYICMSEHQMSNSHDDEHYFFFIFICCTVCIVFRRYIYLILSTWVCFERASSPSHLFTHANRSRAHIVCEHGTRGAHYGVVQCINLYLFLPLTPSPPVFLFFSNEKTSPSATFFFRVAVGHWSHCARNRWDSIFSWAK